MSNQPPPLPQFSTPPGGSTLAYATPSGYQVTASGIFVNVENQIVGPPLMVLPHRCVKCNAPGTVRMRKKYSWHHPALVLIVLINILIYIIVALIVRKRGTAEFSLCPVHAKRRQLKIWLSLLGVPVCIGMAFLAGYLDSRRAIDRDLTPFLIVFSCLGAIFFLLFTLMQLPVLRPKFIDQREMRLANAGEAFLQSIVDEASAIPAAQPAY